jgi:Zn-dependent peptidase ImmA (M78 family)
VRRGFKAEAERHAAAIRERLGCGENDPVSLDAYAKDLGVRIVAADRLVPTERLQELQDEQADAFSAATFKLTSGRRVVVYNSLHAPGRTRSNQAHELAHISLGHTLRTVEKVGEMSFVTCDVEQEEEADWLGGCLLLPRSVLLQAAYKGKTPAQIAEEHGTSEAMARFRLNASGVLVQVGRSRAAKGVAQRAAKRH